MIYALSEHQKILPAPGLAGVCPSCHGEVIPRCGEINSWHWAHKSLADCDTWSEGETAWHVGWKSWFPPDVCEVTKTVNGITHRADVLLSDGWVLEFQNSPISQEKIRERSEFWGKIIWIFNMPNAAPQRIDWVRLDDDDHGDRIDSFTWRHAPRSLSQLEYFVVDFGSSVFLVKYIDWSESPVRGWGHHKNKSWFIIDKLGASKEWGKIGLPRRFDWRTMCYEDQYVPAGPG